ncbi:MAG: RNA-binding S4 domain-containing protein [Cyanobacteria bacterium SIG30]|nr:RNA-binding S4 domain-containing protein [Cyanobacteria bacterium SIG30]
MRLDKFLKISRLIKRRTVANDVCSSSRVLVNGNVAKPSKQIKVGDIITFEGSRALNVRVLIVPDKAVSINEASSLYEVLEKN